MFVGWRGVCRVLEILLSGLWVVFRVKVLLLWFRCCGAGNTCGFCCVVLRGFYKVHWILGCYDCFSLFCIRIRSVFV